MAVKTALSLEEARQLLAGYPVGEVRAVSGIAAGTVQSNYLVETGKGRFVLRLYENRIMQQVAYEAALLRELAARNFPTPVLIEPPDGIIRSTNGKPYCLFAFAEGEHCGAWNARREESLVQTMAELGGITRALHLPGEKERITYEPVCMEKLVREKAECSGTENAACKFRWYRQQLASLELPDDLTKGICHGDYDWSNILFRGDQVSALLDFDDANFTWLLFDFAASTDFFRKDFHHESWNSFPKGAPILDFSEAGRRAAIYRKHLDLPEKDWRHLFDLVKLSILVDCIWYFDRGDWRDFYERRKIEALDACGRQHFYQSFLGDSHE